MKVVKRNGNLVDFDKNKIYNAIMKAMKKTQKIFLFLTAAGKKKEVKVSIDYQSLRLVTLTIFLFTLH